MLGAGREVLTHKAGLALLRGVCVCVRTLLVHSTGPVIERLRTVVGRLDLDPAYPFQVSAVR